MIRRLIKGVVRTANRGLRARPPLAQTPDVDRHRWLFIGGLHRSGTSIVHELLREHPATSGFLDTGVPEDEGQHLQSVFPPAHRLGRPGGFAFNAQAHMTEASPLATTEHRGRLLREWGAYYDLERPVLLEKSPPNLVRARYFQTLFPQASFLFIVRHPLAVALATRKWNDASLLEMLLHWHVAYSIMQSDLPYLRRAAVIRYEDLVADPQAVCDRICALAGLDRFVPQQAVVNHNDKYFAAWRQIDAHERAVTERGYPAGAGPLQDFGYSLTEPFVYGRGGP